MEDEHSAVFEMAEDLLNKWVIILFWFEHKDKYNARMLSEMLTICFHEKRIPNFLANQIVFKRKNGKCFRFIE